MNGGMHGIDDQNGCGRAAAGFSLKGDAAVNEKKPIYSSNLAIRNAVVDDVDTLRDVFRRASLTIEGDRDLITIHPE
ncbi:hypothetical protein [Paenibacillus hemerocallicola]|uniref:hypothetical protein n=1 Tax=Paenibacillus hemerocallicola TaxID=1172614 RepID=UPI001FEAB637|nr:hypothetical protein [Paenibacillus hemerocallicola]